MLDRAIGTPFFRKYLDQEVICMWRILLLLFAGGEQEMPAAVASQQSDDRAREFYSFCKMLKRYLLIRKKMVPASVGPHW